MSTTWDNQSMRREQFMAPGWYIDPADPRVQRRWDGYGWTADAVPAPQQRPSAQRSGLASAAGDTVREIYRRNSASLIALMVCALYLVVDNYMNFVMFGLIPISLSVQAIRRREPLFIAAAAVTAVTVAAPFVLLQR
jgi:hypothetical protein